MYLTEFQSKHMADGIVCNDRGQGSGGPRYLESHLVQYVGVSCEVTEVDESDDPEAWQLARDAMSALDEGGTNEPQAVAVGKPGRNPHNPHQMVYCV